MLRIMLWAEDRDVGPKIAYERYQAMMEARKREGKASPYDCIPLMLFGKRKEAAEPFTGLPQVFQMRPYMVGVIPEEKFLKQAGKIPLLLCGSHFMVGLTHLADGDRKGAHEHFEKAVATKVGGHMYYRYARAFLARMKRDPEWPKWISVKE
jgi:hypothetical protein